MTNHEKSWQSWKITGIIENHWKLWKSWKIMKNHEESWKSWQIMGIHENHAKSCKIMKIHEIHEKIWKSMWVSILVRFGDPQGPKSLQKPWFLRDSGEILEVHFGPFWAPAFGVTLRAYGSGQGGPPRGVGGVVRLRGGPLYNLEASSLPSRGEGEPGVWLVGDSCNLSRPGEPLKGWADIAP